MGTEAPLPQIGGNVLQLLHALNNGPLEQPHWSGFVALLRERLRAGSASMSFRLDASHGLGIFAVSAASDFPNRADLNSSGIHVVTSPPGKENIPPDQFVDLKAYLDPSLPDHANFIRDFLVRHNQEYMRIARITDGANGVAWIAVGRPGDEFNAGEVEMLNALVPHIALSLRIFATIDRERSRSSVSEDAVHRLNFCWLKLDAQARIIDLDANATALLQSSPVFRTLTNGQLVLQDRRTDEAMRAAITELSQQSGARARAFHLAEQPWLDMLLVRARDESLIDVMEPRIIAYVHGETTRHADRGEQLSDLFGLAPREALLAVSLSRGRSIREAANDLGLTEHTAREYTKRIYAKTGTRGQADLVRLILTSAAALA
jgi:DNA-binding CsgD family transcriptional regulator